MHTRHPREAAAPSQDEIESFVGDWYRMLDEHVAADAIVPLVSESELEFRLPEGALRSAGAFREWYEGVIRLFFDEVHVVTHVGVTWEDERALVDVVVNWQARRWRPPAPRSEWIGFDAYQTWEMKRSATTGRPVITRYVVNELRPMPGSSQL